ncbi:integrating conjugative element protein [Pseudomonas aeruginosa]|uniref:integrating conjugative element protein n=1 Tax=Pseudomonas aeruginosa TaxID=287 RepID=UPI000F7F83AB|nr:integrating conjugative element protein [Pseudomonas aeruginosa]RTB44122.1 integrating conjugative element protein [Pseudomonas aeruginosa]
MKKTVLHATVLLALASTPVLPVWATEPLIVVDDRGGASALPYYESLDLRPRATVSGQAQPAVMTQPSRIAPASEADMLPVRSPKLRPGLVVGRAISAPGLRPFFLVGDDDMSREWLRQRAASLRARNAVGMVVNVDSMAALTRLRDLAPGILLSPIAADDLAERLGVRHYPALITATAIEQ